MRKLTKRDGIFFACIMVFVMIISPVAASAEDVIYEDAVSYQEDIYGENTYQEEVYDESINWAESYTDGIVQEDVYVEGETIIYEEPMTQLETIELPTEETPAHFDLTEQNNIDGRLKLSEIKPRFRLSKNGKNVIIIMIDRAVGAFLPFIFNEQPEIRRQFEGFTYYPNTISFGKHTNFAIPAIYGGYEYTPKAMNERSGESLKDKHNEALLVMPTLFSNNGFEVTVTDPAYGNYLWESDLSIYEGMKNVTALKTIARFASSASEMTGYYKIREGNNSRAKEEPQFVHYDMIKATKTALGMALLNARNRGLLSEEWALTNEDLFDNYTALQALPNMTELTDDPKDTFLFFENETPHAASLTRWDSYTPGAVHFNSIYSRQSGYQLDGRVLELDNDYRINAYMDNVAAYSRLGDWFDELRRCGVWNNSRIIVVSDHGTADSYGQLDELYINESIDGQAYNPILLVKDFYSTNYEVSEEFMTNADVISIACEDLIDDPKNPFTGNPINSDKKRTEKQLITTSYHYQPNNDHPTGMVFDTTDGQWWSVHDDIYDKSNWEFESYGY